MDGHLEMASTNDQVASRKMPNAWRTIAIDYVNHGLTKTIMLRYLSLH